MKSYQILDVNDNVLNYCETLSGAKESFILLFKSDYEVLKIRQLTGSYFGEGYHTREYFLIKIDLILGPVFKSKKVG